MSEAPLRLVKDEQIDPELVKIRRRGRIGPILALAVLGLAVVLMVKLRADFIYSLQPETPTDLGPAGAPTVPPGDNLHARIHGALDYSTPGRMKGGQLDTGHRVARVLGTSAKIWIHEAGEAADVEAVYDDAWTGRLRRIDDVPFAGELRAFVEALPPAPRYVNPDVLLRGEPKLDIYGDPLAILANTPVVLEERATDAAIVTQVATDEVKDAAAAAKALADAGFTAKPVVESAANAWSFEVPVSVEDARAKLRAARMFGASATARTAVHRGTWALFHVTGGVFSLGDDKVPFAAVERVSFLVAPSLPDDAWILLVGENPGTLWYMKPLFGVLAVLALLMAWASFLALRDWRRSRNFPTPHLV